MLLAPAVVNRKGEHVDLVEEFRTQGFVRLRVNGKVIEIEAFPKLDKMKSTPSRWWWIACGSPASNEAESSKVLKQRLAESFETCLRVGEGKALAINMDAGAKAAETLFSSKFSCPACDYSLQEMEPRLFSFNNPMGACPECDGLGEITFSIPSELSRIRAFRFAGGAIRGWDRRNQFYYQMLAGLSQHYKFDLEKPFDQLDDAAKQVVLYGSGKQRFRSSIQANAANPSFARDVFEGIVPNLQRRYRETDSMAVREELAKYISNKACPQCSGTRLRTEARHVKVDGRTLHEISSMPLKDAKVWFDGVKLTKQKMAIAEEFSKRFLRAYRS